MSGLKKQVNYLLPVRLQPFRDEGPQGYLSRLSESNLLNTDELKSIGITFDYDILLSNDILVDEAIDPDLHRHVAYISELWQSDHRVWNVQYARFCPQCLTEHDYWRVEWELSFYDVCHHHQVWLVDQCSSCGNKLSWHRGQLSRCSCGSILRAEQSKQCPSSMVDVASAISSKILQQDIKGFPEVLQKTDVEQTQRLIRYLGNYMSLASGKNPLKMRHAGDLNYSWPVTTLAAEVIADWPNAFHHALTQLEKQNRVDGRPNLSEVFGHAYHYVFKALKENAFAELRKQFELWISEAWKGGIAKRNRRITSIVLQNAAWIPASAACDFLGISHQRLDMLIREGTIEGETHISDKGRKFAMVRRDNLNQVKQHLFGLIDMTTAGKILGLQKRRMRQLLSFLFIDAKKLGTSGGAPWAVNRAEVNKLLDIATGLEFVSIPNEGCVSLGHILRYWTWTSQEIAALIFSVKDQEINIVNRLDTLAGICAWIFKETELKNWKIKNQNGLGNWLTITQAAKFMGIKEQVAYELVRIGYLHAEVMPHQMKRGTRIKRSTVEAFIGEYIFGTQIAEVLGCSPRKAFKNLTKLGIQPVSGPTADGLRQVLYLRCRELNRMLEEIKHEVKPELMLNTQIKNRDISNENSNFK
jgi:hypothetical protein